MKPNTSLTMTMKPNTSLYLSLALRLSLALYLGVTGASAIAQDRQSASVQRASIQSVISQAASVEDSGRTAKEIGRIYEDNADALYECYKKAKAATPGLSGSMTVRLLIRPEGKVGAATVQGSTFKNDGLERCVIDRIKRFQFSAVKIQEMQQVEIPVSFED